MGLKGKFDIKGLNVDNRYIGNIRGTVKVEVDLCESKTNADNNPPLAIKTLSFGITFNDLMAKLAYEEIKSRLKGNEIEDVIED